MKIKRNLTRIQRHKSACKQNRHYRKTKRFMFNLLKSEGFFKDNFINSEFD